MWRNQVGRDQESPFLLCSFLDTWKYYTSSWRRKSSILHTWLWTFWASTMSRAALHVCGLHVVALMFWEISTASWWDLRFTPLKKITGIALSFWQKPLLSELTSPREWTCSCYSAKGTVYPYISTAYTPPHSLSSKQQLRKKITTQWSIECVSEMASNRYETYRYPQHSLKPKLRNYFWRGAENKK